MENCPFLTTAEKEISCYEECIFYKGDSTKEECPFKNIEKLGNYDYFGDANKDFANNYYKKSI